MSAINNSTSGAPLSWRIGLIGYGKMGKAIESIAVERGHAVVLKINSQNIAEFNKENLQKADVAIEFTNPHSAVSNIFECFNAGVPLVCGSTGWLDHLPEIKKACEEMYGAFLYASNFSVGVNIFFEVNKRLAQLMAGQPAYDVSIEETHHTQKKDAPSGTAISLAEQVLQAITRKTKWVNQPSQYTHELTITSKRIDPAPGTHSVKYSSAVDDIEIIHTAHSRGGFALGAVLAAEFIHNKKGMFSMQDLLGL
jgi:4-hydroxy-tetrahydrodipicolinate reductase